ADVYPIEMVAAYSAFATLGTRSAPTAIVRVENSRGDVLWEPTPVRAPVMSPEESWIMVNMMKDVVRKGTAAGSVGANFQLPAGGVRGVARRPAVRPRLRRAALDASGTARPDHPHRYRVSAHDPGQRLGDRARRHADPPRDAALQPPARHDADLSGQRACSSG